MTKKYPDKIQKLRDIFFGSQPNLGETTPELRRNIDQHAADLSRGYVEVVAIPTELEPYVRKVTKHAYKVTDEDIAELKSLGYTEDELFEITISAALGAGQSRLNCGLAALSGEVQPTLNSQGIQHEDMKTRRHEERE